MSVLVTVSLEIALQSPLHYKRPSIFPPRNDKAKHAHIHEPAVSFPPELTRLDAVYLVSTAPPGVTLLYFTHTDARTQQCH
jgi:hypothetical protein